MARLALPACHRSRSRECAAQMSLRWLTPRNRTTGLLDPSTAVSNNRPRAAQEAAAALVPD